MEKYRPPVTGERFNRTNVDSEEYFRGDVSSRDRESTTKRDVVNIQEIANRHCQEKVSLARKLKWSGRGFVFLGLSTLMPSLPLYSFSLIGPQALLVGLGFLAAGAGFLLWKPKLKDTNEALLVAVKHGNYLTVPRLALEMNISFPKAEKIINELVKCGVAEIDMDYKDPDGALVYKIIGL